jgi:hypothetical protein
MDELEGIWEEDADFVTRHRNVPFSCFGWTGNKSIVTEAIYWRSVAALDR